MTIREEVLEHIINVMRAAGIRVVDTTGGRR